MISWKLKYYNELSIEMLYMILRIRQEVFIIEQNCNYLDADGVDQKSHHLLGFLDNTLVSYMRIVNSDPLSKHISFGRILVKRDFRGKGIGRQLMQKAIDLFSPKHDSIVMSAQMYLLDFYRDFNFQSIGEEYLEDNIPHIKMIRHG